MSRLILALTLLVVALAACAPAASVPSPSPVPSRPPVTASPSPVATPAESPAPSVDPSPTPAPVVTPRPTPNPTPKPVTFTAKERYLIKGIQRTAIDCRPVREDLPAKAYAGVECRSDDPAVARMGFYLFHNDKDMLAAYYARVRAEGLKVNSGSCVDGEAESAFIPGEPDDVLVDRQACFVNDEGYANFRLTLSGGLYVGLLGRSANMVALEDFVWRGSVDVPGYPTIWSEGAS